MAHQKESSPRSSSTNRAWSRRSGTAARAGRTARTPPPGRPGRAVPAGGGRRPATAPATRRGRRRPPPAAPPGGRAGRDRRHDARRTGSQRLEPHPRSSRPRTVSTRCGRDLPRRSSRHTHKVSPSPSATITSSSWGRSARDPDAVSVHTHRHNAALRASCCKRGVLRGRRHPRDPCHLQKSTAPGAWGSTGGRRQICDADNGGPYSRDHERCCRDHWAGVRNYRM